MFRIMLVIIIGFLSYQLSAQQNHIKIVEEKDNNRLHLFGLNESEVDYDVMITVKGKNFRQSGARPRLVHIPSATKVHLKTLILMRGKTPSYTYDLTVNDSLSHRALKQVAKPIKIKPKKQITVYIPEHCSSTCDTILNKLSNSKYLFRKYVLSENPKIHSQISSLLKYTKTPLDSINIPVLNIGGVIHTNIDTYDGLIEELHKKD